LIKHKTDYKNTCQTKQTRSERKNQNPRRVNQIITQKDDNLPSGPWVG